jgi:hypothetical protein
MAPAILPASGKAKDPHKQYEVQVKVQEGFTYPNERMEQVGKTVFLAAANGSTIEEAAYYAGITPMAIHKNYAGEFEAGQSAMRIKIKQKQLDVALKDGNVQMLIWVGKQHCDQKDRHDFSTSSNEELIREAKRTLGGIGEEWHNIIVEE